MSPDHSAESHRGATPDAVGFGLPRTARIRSARDFRRVYSRGVRAHGEQVVVVALQRRSPGHRLGVSVSKEHGAAVVRNKLKRILREAFRLERPTFPGRYDFVLIPQRRDAKLVLATLRTELKALVVEIAAGRGKRRGGERTRPRGPGGKSPQGGRRKARRDGDSKSERGAK